MKTTIRIPIEDFHSRFNSEYEFLYNSPAYIAGYNEAVRAFDDFCENPENLAFVQEFASFRGDFISSDREAAAFMFALDAIA